MLTLPDQYRILVIDGDSEIHAMVRLSLKGMYYRKFPVNVLEASSYEEAITHLQSHNNIAVVVLDLVLETTNDIAQKIRNTVGNKLIRILLKSNQNRQPARKTIDNAEADGYLIKSEILTNRFYSSIYGAIKTFDELILLEHQKTLLTYIHNATAAIHSYYSLSKILRRFLETTIAITKSSLTYFYLETYEDKNNPEYHKLHLAPQEIEETTILETIEAVTIEWSNNNIWEPTNCYQGFLVPIFLHHNLGKGWIYIDKLNPHAIIRQSLTLLAAHASNILSSVLGLKPPGFMT